MTTLLAPDHPVMDALRRQLEACSVATREFTGHGFFSSLVVADGVAAAPVTGKRLALGDATATIDASSTVPASFSSSGMVFSRCWKASATASLGRTAYRDFRSPPGVSVTSAEARLIENKSMPLGADAGDIAAR
jgi:hypothetical protein